MNLNTHGDLGDVCALMTSARALGKAAILASDHPMCKSITSPARFNALKPLVESQSYIERFDIWAGEKIDYDTASFRNGGIPWGVNLADLHANYAGIKIETDPWLTVEPNLDFADAIVVNRSTRHRSAFFPWQKLIDHYGKDMIFLGLPEEHVQIQNEFARKIEYVPTKNFLQIAEIIQASKFFFGNQSACINVTIGLGKPFCMEMSLSSVDCCYRRPGSHYCPDGEIVNLKVPGYSTFNTPTALPAKEVDFATSPPKQWWRLTSVDGKEHKHLNAKSLMRMVNDYEHENNLVLSTYQNLTEQTLELHPNINRDSHNNQIIMQAAAIKRLVREIHQ